MVACGGMSTGITSSRIGDTQNSAFTPGAPPLWPTQRTPSCTVSMKPQAYLKLGQSISTLPVVRTSVHRLERSRFPKSAVANCRRSWAVEYPPPADVPR
jgi:hypothetical protein